MAPQVLQIREVRCADVHPVRCNVALRASSNEVLTERVCAHGASVHGFTPVWYSLARLAAITEASTLTVGH